MTLRVDLPTRWEVETRKQLVTRAHEVCPCSNATRGDISVQILID